MPAHRRTAARHGRRQAGPSAAQHQRHRRCGASAGRHYFPRGGNEARRGHLGAPHAQCACLWPLPQEPRGLRRRAGPLSATAGPSVAPSDRSPPSARLFRALQTSRCPGRVCLPSSHRARLPLDPFSFSSPANAPSPRLPPVPLVQPLPQHPGHQPPSDLSLGSSRSPAVTAGPASASASASPSGEAAYFQPRGHRLHLGQRHQQRCPGNGEERGPDLVSPPPTSTQGCPGIEVVTPQLRAGSCSHNLPALSRQSGVRAAGGRLRQPWVLSGGINPNPGTASQPTTTGLQATAREGPSWPLQRTGSAQVLCLLSVIRRAPPAPPSG